MEFLKNIPRRVEPIDLGPRGVVYVRSLFVPEALAHQKAMSVTDDTVELGAIQLSTYVCDESGAPVITIEQAREFLPRCESAVLEKILGKVKTLNGLDDASVEQARGKA